MFVTKTIPPTGKVCGSTKHSFLVTLTKEIELHTPHPEQAWERERERRGSEAFLSPSQRRCLQRGGTVMRQGREGWGAGSRSPLPAPPALPIPPPAFSPPTHRSTRGASAGAPAPPTDDDEDFPLNVGLDVDTAAALRVVGAAQAGDVHHAALVHVHHAGCEGGEERRSGWGRPAWSHLKGSSNPFPPTPPHPQVRMDKGGGTCPSSLKSESAPCIPRMASFNAARFEGGEAHYSATDNRHTSPPGTWENVLWTWTPNPRGSRGRH